MLRRAQALGRLPGVLTALTVTAFLLTGCGSHAKPQAVYTMTPSWTTPAPPGGPSTTAFCQLLATDFGHLHDPASTTTLHDAEANYTGFIDAAHTLEAAAPAAIAADARIFVSTTSDFYKALLETNVQHAAGPSSLGAELKSPATAAAIREVEAFTAANCHPDPLG